MPRISACRTLILVDASEFVVDLGLRDFLSSDNWNGGIGWGPLVIVRTIGPVVRRW